MTPPSRISTFSLIAVATLSIAGCGSPQWQVTVKNQGTSPCFFEATMGYANANSQGNSKVSVPSLAAGDDTTFYGDRPQMIRTIKVTRGEDEQLLEPNIEIQPGMRYVIVATADVKLEAAFEE